MLLGFAARLDSRPAIAKSGPPEPPSLRTFTVSKNDEGGAKCPQKCPAAQKMSCSDLKAALKIPEVQRKKAGGAGDGNTCFPSTRGQVMLLQKASRRRNASGKPRRQARVDPHATKHLCQTRMPCFLTPPLSASSRSARCPSRQHPPTDAHAFAQQVFSCLRKCKSVVKGCGRQPVLAKRGMASAQNVAGSHP